MKFRLIFSRGGLMVENTSLENIEVMKSILKQAKRQLTEQENG